MNYLDGTLDLLALDALYSQLNGSIGQNASGMDPTLGTRFSYTSRPFSTRLHALVKFEKLLICTPLFDNVGGVFF